MFAQAGDIAGYGVLRHGAGFVYGAAVSDAARQRRDKSACGLRGKPIPPDPYLRQDPTQVYTLGSTTTAVPYASTSVTPGAISVASYLMPIMALAPTSIACFNIRL